jgi:hypothetical protein
VAAVIGREFEFGLLRRATGVGEREAALGVEELVRRRMLHGVGERFDFTHDRIREVIATGLLALRRKVLHAWRPPSKTLCPRLWSHRQRSACTTCRPRPDKASAQTSLQVAKPPLRAVRAP